MRRLSLDPSHIQHIGGRIDGRRATFAFHKTGPALAPSAHILDLALQHIPNISAQLDSLQEQCDDLEIISESLLHSADLLDSYNLPLRLTSKFVRLSTSLQPKPKGPNLPKSPVSLQNQSQTFHKDPGLAGTSVTPKPFVNRPAGAQRIIASTNATISRLEPHSRLMKPTPAIIGISNDGNRVGKQGAAVVSTSVSSATALRGMSKNPVDASSSFSTSSSTNTRAPKRPSYKYTLRRQRH